MRASSLRRQTRSTNSWPREAKERKRTQIDRIRDGQGTITTEVQNILRQCLSEKGEAAIKALSYKTLAKK